MKLLISIVIGLLVVGFGKKEPKIVPEKLIANPIVEKAVRHSLKKPEGELTKTDLEKVTSLDLTYKKLTEVPLGLEKLTQLFGLVLDRNQLTRGPKGLGKLKRLKHHILQLNNCLAID